MWWPGSLNTTWETQAQFSFRELTEVSILQRVVEMGGGRGAAKCENGVVPHPTLWRIYTSSNNQTMSFCMAFNASQLHFHERWAWGGLIHWWGCRDGTVVRALASHQYGSGSILRSGIKCGLSLLVIYSTPRGFLRVLWFPFSSKTKFDLIVLIVNFSCSVHN